MWVIYRSREAFRNLLAGLVWKIFRSIFPCMNDNPQALLSIFTSVVKALVMFWVAICMWNCTCARQLISTVRDPSLVSRFGTIQRRPWTFGTIQRRPWTFGTIQRRPWTFETRPSPGETTHARDSSHWNPAPKSSGAIAHKRNKRNRA